MSDATAGRTSRPIEVGDRLPYTDVASAGGGEPIHLYRTGRHGIVLLMLHDATCPACREYVDRLAKEADEIAYWDGRVVLVRAEGVEAERADEPFESAVDLAGTLAARIGIHPPAVLVADQWGELQAVEPAGPDHAFIEPAEVVEWLRFMAIQCPECQGEVW